MHFTICSYNWCWVCCLPCGESEKWVLIFHLFCKFYIEIIQSEGHWWLWILLSVGLFLSIIVFPAVVYIGGVGVVIFYIFAGPFYIIKKSRHWGIKCLKRTLALLIYIPGLLIAFVIATALAVPGIAIFYFIFCFNIIGMFLKWLCCSKKGKLVKHYFKGD